MSDMDRAAQQEAVARRFRIESEKCLDYWQKEEGRWRQIRIAAQRAETPCARCTVPEGDTNANGHPVACICMACEDLERGA